jgi:hypothetical protein
MTDPDNKPDPLADKVDALIGKHNIAVDQRNIPVLTDLIEAPEWQPASAIESPIAPAENVLARFTDEEIDSLSHDIFTRVSQRIDSELATSLEARLREQLEMQLSTAIAHVLNDMKLSIANEIGDAVNAALADRLRDR